MAILQRVRLGTHFLFTLMPGPSTVVQTCFGLSQIFFPDHTLIYCDRPNYVMLTYAFQFTGKIPLFSFISTSTVITHLSRQNMLSYCHTCKRSQACLHGQWQFRRFTSHGRWLFFLGYSPSWWTWNWKHF